MDEWQRKISWEDRIGIKTAEKIRIERSIQVSGDNNPSKNPDVAKKISKSLKKYIKENNARDGKNNPFYGKKHTEEFKLKHSKNKKGKWAYNEEQYKKQKQNVLRGENHPNWLGGCSALSYAPGFTNRFKRQIRERDNHECKNPGCEKINNKLCMHHIDYNKKNNDKENLITLCIVCHGKTNFERETWQKLFENLKLKL